MKIYIDFDGTIYNTDKLNQNFINIFIKQNIPLNYIKNLINKYKDFDYISNKLIKEYNLSKNTKEEVDNLYSDDITYKDTINFLKQYYKKHNLILLTYSNNKEYQQKKINSSNLSKYFKDIIITNKDKSKLDNIDYINGIFVDNNPIELKKFYNSKATKLIRIKRNTDKYSKLILDIENIPEFISFKELTESNYINKIGEINYE